MTPEQARIFIPKLIEIATGELGVHEVGNNAGARVEEYQKAVDNRAQHESWCMAFVQWCIKQAEQETGIRLDMLRTEHCLTLWNWAKQHRYTHTGLGDEYAQPGDIMIMQHGDTTSGHTGIVTSAAPGVLVVNTIEGNTNRAGSSNGDGVYRKTRTITGPNAGLHILGFISIADMPVVV